VRKGSKVTIKVKVQRPQSKDTIRGMPVQVQRRPAGGGSWKQVASGSTTAKGTFSAKLKVTKSSQYRGVASQVQQVAGTLGLEHYQARVSPEAKMQYINALQQGGGTVLMIGDGINDAPVLAQADVSMAMGSGAYIAQSNADILLMNSKLSQIGQVLSVARHMRHLMRQNLRWAIAYNVIAVGVALSGLIHPGYASLGMAGSSLLVTLNALRIYRITP